MKFSNKLVFAVALSLLSPSAFAKLNVVTSTTDLAALVTEVGGSDANVDAIAKGTQDPHYVEAKPSFMVKASKADLVVAIGLELEIGWMPSVVRGARNPKIVEGSKGYFEIGSLLDPLEVAKGKVTRAEGDVHPEGNPHVNLDPIRMGQAAIKIAERMGELDSEHATQYLERAKAIQKRLTDKTAGWKARVAKTGIKKVVSYHKTLTYFFDRFGIENPAILEPKPGIPPTSGHILEVIDLIKKQKIPLILVENYFDPTVTRKIQTEVPSVREETIPVAVGGSPEIKTLDDLYESLVKAVEGGAKK